MVPVDVIVPPAGWPSPESMRVSVVLPEPLRPTSPILSPAATRNDTSDIRSRAPKRSSTFWTVSMRTFQWMVGDGHDGPGSHQLRKPHGNQSTEDPRDVRIASCHRGVVA